MSGVFGTIGQVFTNHLCPAHNIKMNDERDPETLKDIKDYNSESDPEGLLSDVKDYNTCEVCGKKIKPEHKECYNCHMDKN